MTTATEMKDRLLNSAAEDSEFRARLIANPKDAISTEIGYSLPESINVMVLEDSASTFHLVLPPSPELTEAELEHVAGATQWYEGLGTPG